MSDPNEIVGHKTFATGATDPATGFPAMRHEPLTRADADAIWAQVEKNTKARAELMPTEQDAVRMMCEAFHRLKELGWKETMYMSSESHGTLKLIEPGSSGIHEGHYIGEWPTGSWWLHDAGDLWPSRPCLAKALPVDTTGVKG